MSIDLVTQQVEENTEPNAYRKLREVVSDAYSFIRSMDANQAFSTVTLEEMMGDQIKRNGESALSNASQFNPYSYDPKSEVPAGLEPGERANFLGASDTGAPTKLDRVLAIQNTLVGTIDDIKSIPLIDVADTAAYTDVGSVVE